MAAFVKQEADEMIAEEQETKNLKHEYTVNTNILIGKLKDNLVQIMLEESPRKRQSIYQKLLNEISRNRSPKRNGRTFPRREGLNANRHSMNQRSCI